MMNGAKAIAKKYNEVSLILRIVVGLVIGAVLALAVPGAGWGREVPAIFHVRNLKFLRILFRLRSMCFAISFWAALASCFWMALRMSICS